MGYSQQLRGKRRQVAAALSAAVTITKPIGNRAHLTGGTNSEEAYTPNASRSSGGSAREGKDSHSRQWRLSMAVFLNRNKRP